MKRCPILYYKAKSQFELINFDKSLFSYHKHMIDEYKHFFVNICMKIQSKLLFSFFLLNLTLTFRKKILTKSQIQYIYLQTLKAYLGFVPCRQILLRCSGLIHTLFCLWVNFVFTINLAYKNSQDIKLQLLMRFVDKFKLGTDFY